MLRLVGQEANDEPDLIQFCVRDNIPFTVFEDWSQIKAKVQEVV
jgi:2-hydroxy-3-keto-5-methylthiopentenyl-1-phosphate phosphatase